MSPTQPKIRLYTPQPLARDAMLELDEQQAHYLAQVMRLKAGDVVGLFNGVDGLWQAELTLLAKKHATVQLRALLLPQSASPDTWLVCVPIKNKTELVVEKATELGVSKILFVYTRYSVVTKINHDKLRARAIEAAEQCERLDVPELVEYKDLQALLAQWPSNRTLLHADESGAGEPLQSLLSTLSDTKHAILIGPEGGFSMEEQTQLRAQSVVHGFGMGPRILRADTAAVAALACVQAQCGDWQKQPSFRAEVK